MSLRNEDYKSIKKKMKDKAFADECCKKGEELLAHAIPVAQESYEKVLKVITEK